MNSDELNELERLQADNERLRGLLGELVDLQNGPPLPKYEADWDRVMEQARAALAAKGANMTDETTVTSLWARVKELEAEVERLRRIEAAARKYTEGRRLKNLLLPKPVSQEEQDRAWAEFMAALDAAKEQK